MSVTIPESELHFTFARSGGPGGQNVNKVESKVLLRWDVLRSPSISEEVRQRLRQQQAGAITKDGELLITSQRYRDQGRNLQDCVEKLHAMIRQASIRPKVRKSTKPTRGSKERRLQAKKHRSSTKSDRRRSFNE